MPRPRAQDGAALALSPVALDVDLVLDRAQKVHRKSRESAGDNGDVPRARQDVERLPHADEAGEGVSGGTDAEAGGHAKRHQEEQRAKGAHGPRRQGSHSTGQQEVGAASKADTRQDLKPRLE